MPRSRILAAVVLSSASLLLHSHGGEAHEPNPNGVPGVGAGVPAVDTAVLPDSIPVDGERSGHAGAETSEDANGAAEEDGAENEGQAVPPRGWWNGILGSPAPNGLYLGLWTVHLKRVHDGISSHRLVGLGWEGLYAKSFINSFGDRTWGVGVHRSMVGMEYPRAGFSLGLRAGVLRGYDERFHDLAGRWPVMPAAELVTTARYGPVGVQVTWAAVVTSIGAFIPLGSRSR